MNKLAGTNKPNQLRQAQIKLEMYPKDMAAPAGDYQEIGNSLKVP